MVVVHNYAGSTADLAPSSSPEIDEDRAYIVGVWVSAALGIILLILFVSFAVGRSRKTEQVAQNKPATSNNQVLGAKDKEATPSKNDSTTVKSVGKNEASADVTNLERPLTQTEVEAKAKKLGAQLHTVAVGESLYSIGDKYKMDWRKIAEVNNLAPPYSLHVGLRVIIPNE